MARDDEPAPREVEKPPDPELERKPKPKPKPRPIQTGHHWHDMHSLILTEAMARAAKKKEDDS